MWEVTLILRRSKTSRSRGRPSLKPLSYHLLAGRSGYFGSIFGIGLSAPLAGCAPPSICIEIEIAMRAPSGQKVRAARFCFSGTGSARVTDDGTAPAIAAIAPALRKSRREVIVLLPNAYQDLKKIHDCLLSSSLCRCCLCLRALLSVPCRFPFDPFQIEYKNRVEDRDQDQRDDGNDGKSAHLRIAQTFPERATFECKRKQRKNGRAYGDHHGSNTLNAGIRKSAFQRLALVGHLLNEVEQDDDMAYDDSNEAGHSKKCHEAKRRSHDCQSD